MASMVDGVFKRFNDANPAQAVKQYDKIWSANGVSKHPDIYRVMKQVVLEQKEELTLNVCRPRRFEAHG